ncbi:MAG: ATP-binding cassette domain-containing protein, partial [Desulfobacterales bacterium]|nr:ATP-binding cassette domain-containing protein [Desulfobacterales bacterium]
MILEAHNVTKSFGGLTAVNALNLAVKEGELSAIIGPNGAGKSTLFDLLSAKTRPDSGTITFEGRKISRLRPHHICHLGIGRSFQKQNIFPRLTALENVQIALLSK